jgi:hypothetical protein
VRHGAQRHPHLVMQLDRGAVDLEVPLHVSDADVAAGKYEGLGSEGNTVLKSEAPKLVAMLLKKVTGKPVFKPGAFLSALKAQCVRASLKSSDGLLYPLDKSMIFVHKPTTWIRYSEMESVEFQRSGTEASGLASAARTFDLAVSCKAAGGEAARTYLFGSLDRSEKDTLKSYLEGRGELGARTAGAGTARRSRCNARVWGEGGCAPLLTCPCRASYNLHKHVALACCRRACDRDPAPRRRQDHEPRGAGRRGGRRRGCVCAGSVVL